MTDGKAWVAFTADGSPLSRDHGGPAAPPRAPPLLLEERQVGVGPAGARPRRTRVLGAQRLPRPRRSLARAALPGRLTVPARRGRRPRCVAVRDETPTAKTFRLRSRAPTGHRAGQHYVVRLTAPDGYTASRSYSVASAAGRTARDRAHGRAARRRRGVDVPPRRRRGRRRARGPRPDRRLLRVGRHRRRRCCSAAAPASCRSWRCCAWRAPTGRDPTSCTWSCRCGRPTTCTTPTSCPARDATVVYTRRRTAGVDPSGRAPHRRRRRPAPARRRRPSTCAARRRSPTRSATCSSTSASPAERARFERFGPSA